MIYCSDLDRTLVFSNKFVTPYNSRNARICSSSNSYPVFMSESSLETFRELQEHYPQKFMFIPATTRSTEQYKTLYLEYDPKYAITCNGAVILEDGKINKEWEETIDRAVAGYYYYFNSLIERLLNEKDVIISCKRIKPEFKDYYIYGKHTNKDKCKQLLESMIDKELFYYTIQGNKYYIIPNAIKKENALKFILKKLIGYPEYQIIVSGDSEVDIGLFECATLPSYFIINSNSNTEIDLRNFNLKRPDILRIIKDKGLFTSDIILSNIKEYLEKKGDEKENG